MRARCTRQLLVALAAAAVVAPIAAAGAAPSSAGTTRAMRSSHTVASQRASLDLLAGSPQYFVYLRTQQLAAIAPGSSTPLVNAPASHLFARRASGATTDLGRAPAGLQPYPSLARHLLLGTTVPAAIDGRAAWHWWNMATGKHGRFRLAKHGGYLAGATPTGAVLVDKRRTFLVTTSGHRHRLTTPPAWRGVAAIVSSDHGMAIYPNQGQLHYMSWVRPGHFTKLRTGPGGAACRSLSRVALGCVGETSDGHFSSIELVPLDGGAPTIEHGVLPADDERLAVVGDTAMWSTASGRLASLTLGSTKVRTGPRRYGVSEGPREGNGVDPFSDLHLLTVSTIAADGGSVFTTHHGRAFELATSVSHARTIVRAGRSPTSVSSFALAPHVAAYIDNWRGSGAGSTTYTASIKSQNGKAPKLGHPAVVKAGTDTTLVGVSGTVTVYSVATGNNTDKLIIKYRQRRHTIRQVPSTSDLQVSGPRIAYRSNAPGAGGKTYVYDAATGGTRSTATGHCCTVLYGEHTGNRAALSGVHLSWLKSDGSVWTKDLTTGATRRISKPTGSNAGGAVFATGAYVAWSVHTQGHARLNSYRNIKTMGPIQTVHQRIVGAGKAGLLLASSPARYVQQLPGYRASYSFHAYGGKTVRLMSRRLVTQAPQVAGSMLAWVDARGRLQVRKLAS